MEAHVFNFDYSKKKEFSFLLASDIHVGDPYFDYPRFKQDFDEALNLDSRIYIIGDIMRMITTNDHKRYHKDEDTKGQRHAMVNEEIEMAENILAPYANNIDIIGVGNHETAIYKYTNFEPMEELLFRLNTHRDVKKYGVIRHGGYTGFIQQVYRYGQHNSTRRFEIWYNHGQGKKGEVTGGTIAIKRRETDYIVNLVWLAHIHDYRFDGSGYMVKVNSKGKIVYTPRRGIITGCYVKPIHQTDSTKNHYRYDYGEATQRTLQSEGGIFLVHTFDRRNNLHTKYILR